MEFSMQNNYDVVIIGSGVSGLYSSINLPTSLKILVISKKTSFLCNSSLAQGGIAGVYDSPTDSIKLHENDTLIAGGFKNNQETLGILVKNASQEIQSILDLGVDFDKNPDGSLHRTLEGGHCRNRIFHHKDLTGFEIVSKINQKAKSMDNIDIVENALLCKIAKTSTGFSCLILVNDEHITVNSHYCIMGTSGIGRVYENTTNSSIATGDGITLAYELGADIKHLSYIQFHPTAFNDTESRECFLISEAVRGEGAYLLNAKGERFMGEYDDRLELAPRDVVSRSIILESKKQGSKDFYLDISHKSADFLKNRFPNIYNNLLNNGIDMTSDRIPIYPCQHYLMGGIDVNKKAETKIRGLFAVGECAHTGVHGINRLASNSLLEALVFSKQAALEIADRINEMPTDFEEYNFCDYTSDTPIPSGIRTEIRHIMQEGYFVIPNKKAIVDGFERIVHLRNLLLNGDYKLDVNYIEAKSLATVAYLILKEVL